MTPTEAYLAVTFRCNCRCRMCDVWRKDPVPEVEPSFYLRLPASLKLVNLTGGEPFLRADLPEIAEAVTERCPGVTLHVSTNGLATDRIVESSLRIRRVNRRVGVRISLDGLGAEHDRVRGVPGAFKKAEGTMQALQQAGLRDLGFAFTLTAGNEGHLLPAYRFARRMGVDFSTAITHSSPLFFGEQQEARPETEAATRGLAELRDLQLRARHPKQWMRAYFTDGLIEALAGRPRKIRCGALRDFFFMTPAGDVYPCPVLERRVGNLADASYAELVRRDPSARSAVDACRLDCWMVCTARPVMRRRLLSCLRWALTEKRRLRKTP